MCALTEPVPSLFIAWFHPDPTLPLVWGVIGTVLLGFLLSGVRSSPDSQDTRLSRTQAALLALGGYACALLGFYWAGALAPYKGALDAWAQRQWDVLSQACRSTVVTPAYNAAYDAWQTRTGNVFVVLFGLGAICMAVASWSRNMHRYRRGVAPRRNS
jgi:hypothetical protein